MNSERFKFIVAGTVVGIPLVNGAISIERFRTAEHSQQVVINLEQAHAPAPIIEAERAHAEKSQRSAVYTVIGALASGASAAAIYVFVGRRRDCGVCDMS